MGIFNNIDKYTNVDISKHIKDVTEIIQSSRGMKLDSDNNYNAENKRLKNVAEGTSSSDAVNKHQLETALNYKHVNTGNINLTNQYNIVNSKQQTEANLKNNPNNLISLYDADQFYLRQDGSKKMTGNLDMNSGRIERVATPRSGQYDAMNYKAFEDLFMTYHQGEINV